MNIRRFACNMLEENCYVVSDDTGDCVVIDCGAYFDNERAAIVNYIRDNQLNPVHLLVTHGHLDHNFGNNTIYDEFGLKPEASEMDDNLMRALGRQAEVMYSMRQEEVADWNRSLILRGINVPDQLKDELIMLLGD